jgi:hypothetical protein
MFNKVIFPSQVIGSGNGTQYSLGNANWAQIISLRFRIDSTPTPGTRQYVVTFLDNTGSIFYTSVFAQSVGNMEGAFSLGAGVPQSEGFASSGSPQAGWFTTGLPEGFVLPPNSTIMIHDGNQVDPNDKIVMAIAIVND